MGEAVNPLEGSPDACEGVEKVGCSVAPVVQHLVKGKDVIVDAIVREVRVLDATKRYGALSLHQLFWGQHLQQTHTKSLLVSMATFNHYATIK